MAFPESVDQHEGMIGPEERGGATSTGPCDLVREGGERPHENGRWCKEGAFWAADQVQ